MKIFRAFLVGIAGFFFLFFVFAALVLSVINITIGGGPQVKTLLKEGRVYDTVVPALLKEVSKQQSKEQNGSDDNKVPIDKPEIVAAAQKGFSPRLLQTNSEMAIDGLFAWLDGRTPTPQFSLDFAAGKDGFADGVGQYAATFMKGLPVCPKGQEEKSDDVFNATCRPANLDIDKQAAQVTSELKNNADIFKNTTVTSESLHLDEKAQTNLKEVPKAYRLFKWSPLILAALAALSGLVIIFASTERRKGIDRVARSLLLAGFVVLGSIVAVTALRTFLNKKIENAGGQGAGFATDVATPLLNKAASEVNHTNMIIGIALVAVAVGSLVTLRMTKPRTPKAADTEEAPEVAAAKAIVDDDKAAEETPTEKATDEPEKSKEKAETKKKS